MLSIPVLEAASISSRSTNAAGLALAARFAVLRVFAIQAFGQDAGDGGFAHAASAGEQVGVVQAAFAQGVLQGFDNVFLPD